MADTIVTGNVTATVTLGSASYPSPLTITSTGGVGPDAGQAGVLATLGGYITNAGQISGGDGYYTVATPHSAGVGIDLVNATLVNSGTILGGSVPVSDYNVGTFYVIDGGVGALLDGSLISVTASGLIAGGTPGYQYDANVFGGAGGAGIIVTAGTLLDNGTLRGGAGGNVKIVTDKSAGTFSLRARGGDGGAGLTLKYGGLASIGSAGMVEGGVSGRGGHTDGFASGGVGAYVGGGTLYVAGNILGGNGYLGGPGFHGEMDMGGAGVKISSGLVDLLTSGSIIGGASGYESGIGGTGVLLQGGSFIASGFVEGGTGGGSESNSISGAAGTGGTGVFASTGTGQLVIAGTVTGGTGGSFYGRLNNYGGGGGTGVYFAGASLVVTGLVQGGISGGNSQTEGHGGIGIDVQAGQVSIYGTVTGGASAYSKSGASSTGGTGLVLGTGTVAVAAGALLVGGNAGGNDSGSHTDGGAGAAVYGGVLTVAGTLSGGWGFNYQNNSLYSGGFGGAGALLDGGTLVVSGTVAGGANGTGTPITGDAVQFGATAATLVVEASAVFEGRAAADAAAGDVLIFGSSGTAGTLSGLGTEFAGFATLGIEAGADWTLAAGGVFTSASAVALQSGTSLTNDGTLAGGTGKAGPGGDGVILYGNAVLTNGGLIEGGKGGYSGRAGYAGGNGVRLQDTASLVNLGTITGGGSAKPAAGPQSAGVALSGNASLDNMGMIAGSTGASGNVTGGTGGTGVSLVGSVSVVNAGLIEGGTGAAANGGAAGAGGYGAAMSGGVLVNDGTITGGTGGSGPFGSAGNGGAGVYLDGGTLENAGTIAGGTAGSGAAGDAVLFGSTAATLLVDPGALFIGNVVADATAADVLALGGTASATLSGIGTQFTGFSAIEFETGASWVAIGDAAAFTTGETITGFTSHDAIQLTDAVAASGSVTVGTAGVVTVSAAGVTYHFDIAGAAVGETDFTFANDALFETGATPPPIVTAASGGGSSLVTEPVTLGAGGFVGPLTIAVTETIAPTLAGATALYVPPGAAFPTIVNHGLVGGAAGGAGTAGGGGIDLETGGALLTGDGVIRGGVGGVGGAVGGTGVVGGVSGTVVLYSAAIVGGGQGGQASTISGTGGAGGTGITLSSGFTLANAGHIYGGTGGYAMQGGTGGVGLALSGASASNSGDIRGGYAGVGYKYGGTGGIGLYIGSGSFANAGTVAGGAGGYGYDRGGDGGLGALLHGGTLNNSGLLEGGAGAAKGTAANAVYLNGGILLNAGTISAGAGAANAVLFGTAAATLAVEAGAVFNGVVQANTAAADALELAAGSGTVSGIGTEFVGFSTIDFAPGASAALVGNVAAFDAGQTIAGFAAGDTIVLDDFAASSASYVSGAGLVLAGYSGNVTLNIAGAGTLGIAAYYSDGGTTISVANPGSIISGSFNSGVVLGGAEFPGPLSITGTGRIAPKLAGDAGITPTLVNANIVNAGTVAGAAGANFGYNDAVTGKLTGGDGVDLNAAGTLYNSGTISGGAGGTTTSVKYFYENYGYGYIYQGGNRYRVWEHGPGLYRTMVPNYSAGGVGVYLKGGLLTNAGTIAGADGKVGSKATYESTVPNVQQDAVHFGSEQATLVVDPGAVFVGKVEAYAGAGDILAVGAGAGTLSGIGSEFVNFATFAFEAGASWTLEGDVASFDGGEVIESLASGDAIELDGFTATNAATYVSGTGLVLTDANGGESVTLDITGNFSTESFTVTTNSNGTQIVVCYLRGTRILTPQGEMPIEALCIGDMVVTKFGGVQPVKWIGRQSFSPRFVKGHRDRLPVSIAAGALGNGLPLRDLSVSPGHSMLIGDSLVLARDLVNGITITQPEAREDLHYYQLEFETHDCVLAEGSWSESYADCAGMRMRFHNHAEYFSLYPAGPVPDEPVLCAPRPRSGPALAAVLRPIVSQAAGLAKEGALRGYIDVAGEGGIIAGWAQDIANPELPVLLALFCNGMVIGIVLACDYRGDLEQAGIGTGRCAFTFLVMDGIEVNAQNVSVRRLTDGAEIGLAAGCQWEAA